MSVYPLAENPSIDFVDSDGNCCSSGISFAPDEFGFDEEQLDATANLEAEVEKMRRDDSYVPKYRRFFQVVNEVNFNLTHEHAMRLLNHYADAREARRLGLSPFVVNRGRNLQVRSTV
jgi:hypothetical protein